MTRELDDRQDALLQIDTLANRPPVVTIAPSRRVRLTRWQRFCRWLGRIIR